MISRQLQDLAATAPEFVSSRKTTAQQLHEKGLEQGRQEGRQRGLQQGTLTTLRDSLLRLGVRRFGPPSPADEAWMQHADADTLRQAVDLLLDATGWHELRH